MNELKLQMPAEWEPHEATWLTWPKDPLTWPERLPQAEAVYLKMIQALARRELVHLLVDDAATEGRVRSALGQHPFKNLKIHILPTADSWIRDYGPIFVRTPEGTRILDWEFNAWGNKYPGHLADDDIPQKIGRLLDIPVLLPGIVMEGGSIEVNGKGSLLTTEQCLLNTNRNPKLTRHEIESYLREYLGVSQILWLGEGVAGDDTDGHIDDIARFVGPDTILTAVESDRSDPNFRPLQDNLKRLRAMRNLEGHPFEIVEMPMPRPVLADDGPLPASYVNFYIANGIVLLPTFQESRDVEAKRILQKVFPDREIIGIEAQDLVWGMGAFHCLTQQQPKI